MLEISKNCLVKESEVCKNKEGTYLQFEDYNQYNNNNNNNVSSWKQLSCK
jgi:hypothetical protein